MKYIFIFFISIIFIKSAFAQTVGSKVNLVGQDGKNYTGVITNIQGSKYQVKYDGYDFSAWLTSDQFIVAKANPPAPNGNVQNNTNAPSGCGCQPMINPAKTGVASAELFKNLIRALWDKPAQAGYDGMVCTTITDFRMAPPQQWRPELNPSEIGTDRLGTKPKTIYRVKLNFIKCTTYNSSWETTTWTDAEYVIFKDENFGDWKAYGENGGSWKFENKRIERK